MSRCCPLHVVTLTVVDSVRDLGVIIDSQLRHGTLYTSNCCYIGFHDCVWTRIFAALCRGGYYQLRQLRPIIQSLPTKAAETLVHVFVSSRLDYCNALLYGVADGLYRRLQSVQNAAVRLVSGLRRRDHIRPTLLRLHWLPVRQRVLFKVAVLVYQCLNDLAPS